MSGLTLAWDMSRGHCAQRHPGCAVALRPTACRFDGGRGSGGDVVSRLARPAPGRRLGIEREVGEDLPHDRPLQDGRDGLQLTGAAVRALRRVNLEDALEQRRPTVSFVAARADRRTSSEGRSEPFGDRVSSHSGPTPQA